MNLACHDSKISSVIFIRYLGFLALLISIYFFPLAVGSLDSAVTFMYVHSYVSPPSGKV